jgi:hypothetical protein
VTKSLVTSSLDTLLSPRLSSENCQIKTLFLRPKRKELYINKQG